MNSLPFRILYEDWGEANLPDGTTLRFRGTLAGLLEGDGGPTSMQMRLQPQMQAFAAEEKKRLPKLQTKRLGPVEGFTSGPAASAYEHRGGVIRFTTLVRKVFRTDGYDGNGEPIFEVEMDQQVQGIGAPTPPLQPAGTAQ